MRAKSITTLEFDKITALAADIAVSQIGKELLLNEEPCCDFTTAALRLSETEAAESIQTSVGYYPILFFPDVRSIFKKISAVFCLDNSELLNISQFLKASRIAKRLVGANGNLQPYTIHLADYEYIENEINRCILTEDEIADKASPALYKIRFDLKVAEERIKEKINALIKGNSQKYLQEQIYTIRNGRYVIPVKAEYKSYIPGLIHDQSSSGQTFFIEPAPIVEYGNKYRTLLLEEQKEIQRILASLTTMVSSVSENLYDSAHCLGHLDALFAKSALAKTMNAIRPKLNSEYRINLINARHPLLDTRNVVPVSIWIGDKFNTLVITGPNTGGKTVSLKTVGLLCLMAQSGYFVPADFGSELPVFSEICSDIGDEQSIEQSLSTFSSHMKNIVQILQCAGHGSLVLLDELGAGTDPAEGAALAQAILEYLNDSGSITFATTHYSEIKSFAVSTPGMENASMEFDVEKLVPTYRMRIGIPGRSNAFEISKRLGISNAIITRAKDFLTENELSLENVLSKAEENRLETEQALLSAKMILADAKTREDEIIRQQEKYEALSSVLKSKAREEAREIIREAKMQADSIINVLRNTKGLDAAAVERKANEARTKLRNYGNLLEEDSAISNNTPVSQDFIKVGQILFSNKLQRNVTIIQLPDGKNEVLAQIGSIKTKLPSSDLSQAFSEPAPKTIVRSSIPKLNVQTMKMELDLRGSTVDNACLEIDRYIDMCYMHSRKEFVIIHGKGTGALREGIHNYLKKCKSVASFHIGAYGEGDAGVTVVTLKNEK